MPWSIILRRSWNKLTVWNVPVEKDIIKRYEKALNAFEPKMEEIKQNIAAKSTIVDQAKKLLDADNFRNARNELDKLKDSLREIGSAGSAKDDEFHEQIREIENTLRTKQKDFNEHINESRSTAETKKTELISQAKKLVSNVSNFKETNVKMNELFDACSAEEGKYSQL
jgi:Domain of Unknown Function (DUF349).